MARGCRVSTNQTLIAAVVLATVAASVAGQQQFLDVTGPRMPGDADATGAVALGDVDGDGDNDIVFGSWRNAAYPFNQAQLYLNDGLGKFIDATATRIPITFDSTEAVALADVDGDGDLDLALGNWGQSELFLNDGTGTFSNVTATRMPRQAIETNAVVLGDVDMDGDLDMVVGNGNGPRQSWLYLNDGSGTFQDVTAARMPRHIARTNDVALADVDNDGDLDLVLANGYFYYYYHPNLLYLNDGTGTFTDATAARLPPDGDDSLTVDLGDVDGDGDLDMVFGNGGYAGSDQNRLYLNDGSGTFIDATATHMPAVRDGTQDVVLGDMDGDGDLDLVAANWGQNRLYLNDGTGTFSDVTVPRMPSDNNRGHAAALEDVDADGDLDMVFGNGGWYTPGQQNRLYLNLLRHLDAPLFSRLGGAYRLDAFARYGPPGTQTVAGLFLSTGTGNLALPPWGTFRLDPSRLAALPPRVIPPGPGLSSVTLMVPNAPGLVGVTLYAQALIIQPPAAYLTNLTADQIHP